MKLNTLSFFVRNHHQRCYGRRFTPVAVTSARRIRDFRSLIISFISIGTLTYYYYPKLREDQFKELSPTHFTPYKISHKMNIDPSHFLLELTPVHDQRINLWSQMRSDHLWSIEIKQPEIMITRSYTPLPLQVDDEGNLKPIPDGSNGQGKFILYLKWYNNGEVSKWLHSLPLDHTIEIRGPFTEYELPTSEGKTSRNRNFLFHDPNEILSSDQEDLECPSFDIAMFTAGTGIVSALQLLLTESPLRGKMRLWYSCGSVNDLGPLKPYLYRLEKYGRIDLQLIESSKEAKAFKRLETIWRNVPPPTKYPGPSTYLGINKNFSPVLALVCGPERYIADIAGPKINLAQGPIGGILKEEGWTRENVYKLSD